MLAESLVFLAGLDSQALAFPVLAALAFPDFQGRAFQDSQVRLVFLGRAFPAFPAAVLAGFLVRLVFLGLAALLGGADFPARLQQRSRCLPAPQPPLI